MYIAPKEMKETLKQRREEAESFLEYLIKNVGDAIPIKEVKVIMDIMEGKKL